MSRDIEGLIVQATVSFIILMVWAHVQWYILHHPIPEASHDLVLRAMGILDAMATIVASFWLGTSLSSKRKDEAISTGDK